ncbi:arylesterase-related protein [Parvularcula bermudensis HTCC2503]|uniref:Arylesterase-related protein n=1 Tax=Parvularcula bermudensis (strain ATCC BAA-594 / HTCC2503 / KCTC 12087) TaxID=314260 RepID=E0TE84_PARBH|nr:alpha/beta fold hydrolase [Parvularcula bermudensis]ADM09459.1 arylesterase-related protein [Parvularcula bermudensis HTCC2503]
MAKQPIVLIHGTWATGNLWREVPETLEALGFEVHTPTLRHHDHDFDTVRRTVSTASLTDYVDDLVAYCRTLPVPPLLLGHSLGGLLAQLVASRPETEIAGLILASPAPSAGMFNMYPSMTRMFFVHHLHPLFWRRPVMPDRKMFGWGVMNEQDPGVRDEIFEQLVPESGRAYFQLVFWYLDPSQAARVDDRQITMPTLVINGTKDRIVVPRVSRLTAARFERATHREVEGADHSLLWGRFHRPTFGVIEEWLGENSLLPVAA